MNPKPQKKRCTSHEAWTRRIDRFPPILVRLLAREWTGDPMSSGRIALRSGLLEGQIYHLSWLTSWAGVTLFDHIAFCRACNLDLMNSKEAKRQERYLNGTVTNGKRNAPKFEYLKSDVAWETFYRPMMERYIQSLKAKLQQ